MSAQRIAVLGVGNVVRSDDGLGIHALHRLAADPRLPRGHALDFIDGGTRGLELVADTAGASRVLVLDAIDVGAVPATLVSLDGPELSTMRGGWSVHQLGLVDWMTALLLLDGRLPEIAVLGLQPERTGWGTTLSPVVADAVDRLLDAALRKLEAWTAAAGAPTGEPAARAR